MKASVVIPNRDRVAEIGRTLKALKHQSFRNFEVIVVSNQPDVLSSRFSEMADVIQIECEAPNISLARNLGLEVASGEFVAFIDDDAVPEPTWLERLLSPFDDRDVAAVGGLVRGRNGVSLQWGPQEVDCFGNDWPLTLSDAPITQPTSADRALKTVGTNCAFRAETVIEMGFDLSYKFFLDETDLNWRMAKAGLKTVIVPDAEVHHGYAASAVRTSERVPTSLKEIGASKASFCQKWGDPDRVPEELDGFRLNQKRRLIRVMELGFLEPGRIGCLLDSLEEGFIEGAGRTPQVRPLRRINSAFKPYVSETAPKPPLLITARLGTRRKAYDRARQEAGPEQPVTLIDLSHTSKMMTVRFTDDGIWLHKGGVYGRTERKGPVIFLSSFSLSARKESNRVAVQRNLGLR